MKKLFFLLCLLCILSPAGIYPSGSGTSGGVVFSLPASVKASGMAEAYTACDGDLSSVHYNPAGIASMKNNQLSLFYRRGIAEDNFSSIAYGAVTKAGVLACSILYYSAGNIELIDLNENSETVNAQSDYLGTLSYARTINKISLGLNFKFLKSTLVQEFNSTALGFDTGLLYNGEGFGVGLSLLNAGTKLKYQDKSFSLPLTVKAGVSYWLIEKPNYNMVADFDISKQNDTKLKENVGCEFSFKDTYFLRTGYKIGYDEDTLSFGIGVAQNNISVDYALSLMGELGLTHNIGFCFKFGAENTAEEDYSIHSELIPESQAKEEKAQQKNPNKYVEGSEMLDAKTKIKVQGYYDKGNQLMGNKDYEGAMAEFKKVLMFLPNHKQSIDKIKRCKQLMPEEENE
ncbi:MAG: PorV/PorQ family protein [Elusimicrobia bacterium]|nr:PorV/PorQ family protein [Elusimicrobiota bacterium]